MGSIRFIANFLTLFVAIALLQSAEGQGCSSPLSKGELTIHGAGKRKTVLMGNGGSASDDKITIKHGSGFTLFDSCEQEWKPESITQFKLLGHEIAFDVNLSHVGCGCNLAFYLISMPARDIQGDYNKGDNRGGQPPYYCDANMVGGQWCPEVDIMEANDHAFQATPHNCESPENGHYSYCDRSGCSTNTRSMDGAYGPGGHYKIDTTRPFHVRTEFFQEGGGFAGMRTTLEQDSHQVALNHKTCDQRYLAKLTGAMSDGMSLRVTYWGDSAETMAWLDRPPCGGGSCTGEMAGDATISNITVSKLFDAALPQGVGENAEPSKPHHWESDEWAPWQCHHYSGNQQETMWCEHAGFEHGWEYKYTGGLNQLCGYCWCCKRQAKLVEDTPSSSTALPEPWQSPTTAQPQPQPWQAPPAPTPAPSTEAPTTQKATTTPEPPALEKGRIQILGYPNTYLAGQGGSVDGDKILIQHNAGFSIFKGETPTWDPEHIAEFKLVGKSIKFNVDLREVGCACNLAFYLIAMPARNPDGKPSRGENRDGQPPFYCDANKVGGQWCPEIDIMEANNHAFQATLHRCDAPRHRHYDFCDRGGCAQNTRELSGAYGPGSQHKIDTMRPFDVETEFLAKSGKLTGMRTTLRQRGHRVVLEHSECNEGYLAKLTDAMKSGMSLRITYWGDEAQSMAWMDVPPCEWTGCSGANAGNAIISDIQVSSAGEDGPKGWVVADPKDALFGQLVPQDVMEDETLFKALKDQGVAEWDNTRHFIRHMRKDDIAEMVRDKPPVAPGMMAPPSPGVWTPPPMPGVVTPPPVWTPPPAPVWTGVVARFVPKAVPEFVEKHGSVKAAGIFVVLTTFVAFSAVLLGRRVRPMFKRSLDGPMERSAKSAKSSMYKGANFVRAATASPSASTPSSANREGPSPIRRSSRLGMMMSPTAGSRLQLLQEMEACVE